MKQNLRNKVSTISSYAEIVVSFMILIGIILYSVVVIKDLVLVANAITHGEEVMGMEVFLGHGLQLIIGIEFVKMLSKHTPGSTVEVLLFAVARKLIVNQDENAMDLLIGVIAITILFIVKKYLSTSINNQEEGIVVNGGLNVSKVNKAAKVNISSGYGHSVAGVITNTAKSLEKSIKVGLRVFVDDACLEVYSMDQDLIKQVKVCKKNEK